MAEATQDRQKSGQEKTIETDLPHRLDRLPWSSWHVRILIALSTSGRSANVIRAMEAAKGIGMSTIALTGRDGGRMRDLATVWLPMPSSVTARIQEAHIAVIHAISEVVEATLFEATR